MTTSIAQIDQWRNLPRETQNLEFKEAKNNLHRERLFRYCVALANEGGGHMLLGITDKPPRQIVGSIAFPDTVKSAEDIFANVGFRVNVEEVHHPDGRVLVLHIPARPIGTAYAFKGAYLMRAGAALVPMSEDRLRAIFSEGAPDWLEGASQEGLDAQDVVELLDTQTFFELMKLPYPSSRDGVIAQLKNERLIDEIGGVFSIRRIGAVLLAKRLSEFPDLARKSPRVIVYTGVNKLETRIDQTGERGYAVGFQGLVGFVVAQTPQNEIIKDALRQTVALLPEHALRELVANALIHQDFSVTGAGPMIEVYSNRIEISNPGESVVPVDRFIDGYRSRNERLTDLMRRMDICEERSSGIDRVVSMAEVYQLPAPEFLSDLGRTTVVVHGHRKFEGMTKDDRIRACHQHCVLRWVVRTRMTNKSLRERFGLPKNRAATASKIIGDTIDAGLIKPDEAVGASRKYARYLPVWA